MAAGAAILFGAAAAHAQSLPAGYPTNYADVIAGAKKEGKVSIYTSTDLAQAQRLMDAFKAAYPGIQIDWNDLGTNGSYNRVISEAAANQMGADIVWSSAMDLQLVLVDKGYAVAYASPEQPKLPAWAVYKGAAYGTSVEPAAIVYNKTLLPADAVPKTRPDLIRIIKERRDSLKGKVATYDPEKSGSGFLWATNDARNTNDFWELVKAFGAANGKLYSSSGQLREKVVSGEHVLLFNVIGSYALEWAKANPALGVVFQSDYTPAFSRVAILTKGAPHPNAGRLFLDYMMSKEGQRAAAGSGIPSVRDDVEGGLNMKSLNALVGGSLKPIPLDATTVEYLDPKRRTEFFQHWKKAIQG
jgi:iron(III) transport system substrate-binding protein